MNVAEERRVPTAFRPGNTVIWLKRVVFSVKAKVLSVTAKRIKIEADDPEEMLLLSDATHRCVAYGLLVFAE